MTNPIRITTADTNLHGLIAKLPALNSLLILSFAVYSVKLQFCAISPL